MTETTPTLLAARDALAGALRGHGPSGLVHSGERWVECLCDARLPVSVDRDGYPFDSDEEDEAWVQHRVDVLATVVRDVTTLAADETLVDAAESAIVAVDVASGFICASAADQARAVLTALAAALGGDQ